MADEQQDVSALEQQGYGDHLRTRAALARALAETQRAIAAEFAALGGHGFDTTALSERAARAAQGLDQLGSLHAETALAYDDMIAAGGPENSRAYVEYEATVRRNIALRPGGQTSGE